MNTLNVNSNKFNMSYYLNYSRSPLGRARNTNAVVHYATENNAAEYGDEYMQSC